MNHLWKQRVGSAQTSLLLAMHGKIEQLEGKNAR